MQPGGARRLTERFAASERFLYTYTREGRVRAGVCYPNSYRTGMSNLGFHGLFHRVASYRGLRVSRFFLEKDGTLWSPDERDGGASLLARCDLLFFTLSFELDYLNMIRMLEQSEIRALRSARRASTKGAHRMERSPLVVAGGITVTANPLVLAPFADVICRGDMEGNLLPLLDLLKDAPFADPQVLLREAASLPGLFVPDLNRHPKEPVYVFDLSEPLHSFAVTPAAEFARMFLVEVARGCRSGCRFCMTRCVSPSRLVPGPAAAELAGKARHLSNRAGLIAPVVTDHPDLVSLVRAINSSGMKVSFSSLRADHVTEEIALLIRENRQTSVTFAPETGTVELRRKMGKPLTDRSILEAVSRVQRHGVRRFRFYFMYGLPGESEEDILAIGDLVREALGRLGKGTELHLSINPFVPKKRTPLERFSLYPMEYYKSTRSTLSRLLDGLEGLSVRFESLRTLQLHYYLSMGNREVGNLLHRCVTRGDMKRFAGEARSIMEGGS